MLRRVTHKKASSASQSSFCYFGTLPYSALVNSVFTNTFKKIGLNLTFVYKYTICMACRFHFPIRKYDFKTGLSVITHVPYIDSTHQTFRAREAPLLCGRSLLHELLFFVTKLSPSFILLSLLIVLYRQYVFKCTIYIYLFSLPLHAHTM